DSVPRRPRPLSNPGPSKRPWSGEHRAVGKSFARSPLSAPVFLSAESRIGKAIFSHQSRVYCKRRAHFANRLETFEDAGMVLGGGMESRVHPVGDRQRPVAAFFPGRPGAARGTLCTARRLHEPGHRLSAAARLLSRG